jgi:hypothetical protein
MDGGENVSKKTQQSKTVTINELVEILMESAVISYHGNVQIGGREFLAKITWNDNVGEYVIRLFEC